MQKRLTYQLKHVVHDVHAPDFVAHLGNTDRDTIRFDSAACALDDTIKTHTLGTERQRQDLDRVEVVPR